MAFSPTTGATPESLNSLMLLLADPTEYLNKLTALTKAQQDLDKRIELVGAADEIMALRDVERQKNKDTDELCVQRQQEAQDLLDQAKANAQATVLKAQQQADAIIASANGVLDSANIQAKVITDTAAGTADKIIEDGEAQAREIVRIAQDRAHASELTSQGQQAKLQKEREEFEADKAIWTAEKHTQSTDLTHRNDRLNKAEQKLKSAVIQLLALYPEWE